MSHTQHSMLNQAFGGRTQSLAQPLNHAGLMEANPGSLRNGDSPLRVIPLSKAVGEPDDRGSNGVPESILLDREERELVKKGDDVTK